MSGRNIEAIISHLPFTGIVRYARFDGPFFIGCVFLPVFFGPCLFQPCQGYKVLSEAALIGWADLYGLARPRLPRLIGVLAGFFENWGKPARFLDLLLEPFLPMPI